MVKRICILVSMVFLIIMQTSYSALAEEVSPQDTEKNKNSQDAVGGDEYERQANSWRYQDGYINYENDSETLKSRASFIPWSKVNGYFINNKGDTIEGAIKKGIDVSAWQGNVDWEKVKASGIDFAIIRCGYGSDIKSQDDKKWARNVAECERLGIPYGVYLYSYADTDAKAKSEADHVLRLLKGHNPDYPVYYDLEDKVVEKSGRTAIIRRADIFCSAIEANGYEAGIYANLNWWNNKLNSSILDKYDKWIAQWYSKCEYKGEYRLWQCTSDGNVPGINGRVDLNFEFFSENTIIDVKDYTAMVTKAKYLLSREKPSDSFKSMGEVYLGEAFTVTRETQQWGEIDGKRWVKKAYISKITDVEDYDAIVTSAERLQGRKGPSEYFENTKSVYRGDEVTIKRIAEGWGEIEDGSWIKTAYLTKK